MKAYSQDLRERVLRAVDQGYPKAEIVQLFGISRASIKRYLRTTTRGRACAAQSDSWAAPEETGNASGWPAAPITSV
jgi:transposase